jgi:hypothetical protein
MPINERQIALRKGGNYPNLDDFFDRRKVIPLPFDETAQVAVSSANFVLIDSSMTVASLMAIGLTTTSNASLFATLLAGAVGTGSTNITSDTLGNILNMVKIRDATTHDPVLTSGDREVYALVQAVSTASDGDAIGAVSSENMQLSFVYVAADGTLTLTTIDQTIEFMQNNVYLERETPTIRLEGGNEVQDVLGGIQVTRRGFLVTTAFIALENIDTTSGSGGGSGLSTPDGDAAPTLGATAAAFNTNNLLEIRLNGVIQRKGTAGANIDVSWVSATSLEFALAMDPGDYFEIRLLSN